MRTRAGQPVSSREGDGSFCGHNVVVRFFVLDDEQDQHVPALIPISLLSTLEAVIDCGSYEITIPLTGVNKQLTRETSGHLSTSLLDFEENSWTTPIEVIDSYGCDPFRLNQQDSRAQGEDVSCCTLLYVTASTDSCLKFSNNLVYDTCDGALLPQTLFWRPRVIYGDA